MLSNFQGKQGDKGKESEKRGKEGGKGKGGGYLPKGGFLAVCVGMRQGVIAKREGEGVTRTGKGDREWNFGRGVFTLW